MLMDKKDKDISVPYFDLICTCVNSSVCMAAQNTLVIPDCGSPVF